MIIILHYFKLKKQQHRIVLKYTIRFEVLTVVWRVTCDSEVVEDGRLL